MKEQSCGFALVTGATSGLGLAIAEILHAEGMPLILVARRWERLDALKERFGPNTETIAADLSEPEALGRVCARIAVGDVTYLINNAGFGRLGESGGADMRENEMLALNASAVVSLTGAFLRARREGRILNVASMAAFSPSPLFAVYAASKSFVYSYSRAVAEELRAKDSALRVSVLCPGTLATEFDGVAGAVHSRRGISLTKCAAFAVRGMKKGRTVLVPGFGNKLLRLGSKVLPDGLLARIARRVQAGKI